MKNHPAVNRANILHNKSIKNNLVKKYYSKTELLEMPLNIPS